LELEVTYQDDFLIAINKPHGLLVHKTNLAMDADNSVLKVLRAQLNKPIFTIHRLDRKTSGVLLIALDKKVQRELSKQFMERSVHKTYLALVRGFTSAHGTIDYAVKDLKGKIKDATTHYKTLKKYELDLPFGKHLTSRYSLVELKPETGRYHQLRMHMAHIFHPIVGDRPHGCNKQNRLFKERFDLMEMMLHAKDIEFFHPALNRRMQVCAPLSDTFNRMLNTFEKENILS